MILFEGLGLCAILLIICLIGKRKGAVGLVHLYEVVPSHLLRPSVRASSAQPALYHFLYFQVEQLHFTMRENYYGFFCKLPNLVMQSTKTS